MKKTIIGIILIIFSISSFAGTSKVVYPDKHTDYWSGTAFFISPDGYLATAGHVVNGAKNLRIYYKGQFYNAKLVSADYKHDTAIVKVNLNNTPYFKINSPKEKDLASILGFPSTATFGFYVHITTGVILFEKGNNTSFHVYAFSCHGNSGGPVINNKGQAIGILVSGYFDMTSPDKLCSSHAGVIYSSWLLDLAVKNNVPIESALDMGTIRGFIKDYMGMNQNDLLEAAAKTVYIEGHN